jgi:hypothetical protein
VRIPVLQGVIDRRILVNFAVDAHVLARVVPPPFRPKVVRDTGIAGICLIRLRSIRPRFAPSFLGIASENAAHRIAVEWDEQGRLRSGVFIPRRDTSSKVNSFAGGRLFPGEHYHARFDVKEDGHSFRVAFESDDGVTRLSFSGQRGRGLPADSVFRSMEEASQFFKQGSLGYSARKEPGTYDGLELKTLEWEMEPLVATHVESSFFADRNRFPEGSVRFDSALVMRNVPHEWHGRDVLHAPGRAGVRTRRVEPPHLL